MEIVESEIEKVLPAYRAAMHCELLSEAEVGCPIIYWQ